MKKKEQEIIDKYVKKITKLNGDLIKNAVSGAHEIWIKKADLIPLLNEMIKALREEQWNI